MTYDHWKATNPEDEWLGPDPDEDDFDDLDFEAEPSQHDDHISAYLLSIPF